MATVYILYSKKLDNYYTGSCLDLNARLQQHNSNHFKISFTGKANDWIVFLAIDKLAYSQARQIEKHIKKMKSRKYIENLKSYPEMKTKLIAKYYTGSSR